MVKRQREEKENGVASDLVEKVFDEHAASLERDQERVKERLLKKTYSKKNKRVSAAFFSIASISVPLGVLLFHTHRVKRFKASLSGGADTV